MTSQFHKKVFIPTAPIKGSFPLDHDGVCKEEMADYMVCMKRNSNECDQCREQAKNYFHCRMVNNLMDKEDWSKLGYGDVAANKVDKQSNSTSQAQTTVEEKVQK